MANDKYKQSLSLCAFGQSRPPNVNDDASKGFSLGSIWSYEGRIYKLKNPANGAAEWFNSSQRFQQFPVYTVATEEVDLGVQTIQGVNQITSLFTAQADPADNGFYSWSGSSWGKPTFPFGVWLEEYDMLSGCLFTALDGTETGKGYVLNNGVGNFEFIAIGGTGSGDVIQKTFELDFDGSEDTFVKTHNYYNDYITYSIRKADGSYYKETEYDVTSTTTTFTVVFVTPPSAGTGKLTLQSVQNAEPSPSEGFTADSTTITADSTLVTADIE